MKKLSLISISAAILGLSACGGGGGGGGSTPGATVSLGGVASKGLLSKATVEAFEVVSGKEVSLGASTTTDDKGAYTLTGLRPTTNPVIVHVTVTAATDMLDELGALDANGNFPKATDKIKPGTLIRSVLPSLATNSEVVVSPYTEIAVAAAASTGTLNAQTLASAQDTVVQLTGGVDPFKTKPINASDMASATPDQKKLMLLLTSVARDAKAAKGRTGCDDPSGVACALKDLNDKAQMEQDSNGNYKIKNAAALSNAVDASVTALKNDSSINSAFITAAKSESIAVTTPSSVDPALAVQSKSLDAFLASIRNGFNSALVIMKDRSKAADARISKIVFDSVDTGFSSVDTVLSSCKLDSAKQFVCTNSNLANGPKFTGSPGSYTFKYSSGNSVYTYQGNISATLSNAGDASVVINNTRKKGSAPVESVELSVSGSGLAEGSTSATVKVNTLLAKKYDTVDSSTKYASVSLSGLTISGNKNTRTIAVTAPVSLTTSDGDTFTGSINNLILKDLDTSSYSSDSFGSLIDASFKVKSTEGNILSIDLVGTRDITGYNQTGFHPWLEKSSTNIPNESASIVFTLADDSTVVLTKTQSKYNEATLTAKAKTGSSYIALSGVVNIDSYGNEILNSDGLTITSSGVYNATVKKDTNGEFQGTLYEGTTKIGVIVNGIVYVGTDSTNGKQVSLK